MRSYIVCLKYDGGGYVYWTGYATSAYGATMQALKALRYNATVNWVAENPVIIFDIEGNEWEDE
jgi:hypothetical protein